MVHCIWASSHSFQCQCSTMAIAPGSRSGGGGTERKKMSRLSSPEKPASRADAGEAAAAPTRNKDPGLRVMGSRIYDPKHGKSCHQCRQKTMDFTASCTELKKGDKICTIKFCHKCLLNRYGENAEQVEALGSWICPKCRGVCNCSFCMKRKGQQPTGMLIHTAKATGYNSVLELLHHRGSEGSNSDNALVSDKGGVVAYKRRCDKEKVEENKKLLKKLKKETASGGGFENSNSQQEKENIRAFNEGQACNDEHLGSQKVGKLKNKEFLPVEDQQDKENSDEGISKKHTVEGISKRDQEDVVLPQGTPLVEIAGMEFAAEDVGPALQFLEFCKAFSKVLHLKKGQSEAVLQEVAGRCFGRWPSSSSLVQFLIRLLSLIRKDKGESASLSNSMRRGASWLEAFGKCISESECPLKEPSLDCFKDSSEYNNLDPTAKLRLLNFLCDETLQTGDLRSWVEKENAKFCERKKEIKEKVVAANRKVKDLKQKLKVDLAKHMLSSCEGVPLSVSAHNDLISKIRTESEKAHAEMLESVDLLPKKKQRQDAVRTEPLFLDGSGGAYWKLSGLCSSSSIFHQDTGKCDLITSQDKWFFYDEENEKIVEKHISSLRIQRPRERRKARTFSLDDAAERMKSTPKNSTSPKSLDRR